MKTAIFTLFVILFVSVIGSAKAQIKPPEAYAPLLPAVKEKMWKIDPNVGYAVKNVGNGVYVISDNGWQSAWLVTNDGVIVFDAPETFGKYIPAEVAKVTKTPIKMLIYSHQHRDHLGGSPAFKNIKGLQIVATDGVAAYLKEQKDPERLIPNVTFDSEKTIKMGGKTVELTRHYYHSQEGDLFIYVPEAKFLMAIDCVTPGYAPFMGFDLTTNFGEYLKVFDQLLAYKFDTFVGGHLTDIGTRGDVETAKEFAFDVYNTVKRIHNNMDQKAYAAEIAQKVGWDPKFVIFKEILDEVTQRAVAELLPRWKDRLAMADVFMESHVQTALIYVSWDDKL
jgi:glyoxylase-like metal-dependent hydrolase (beta-lactamase superfamily II)